MRTLHVLILAGAILDAAWILKPVPVEQISQVELQRRKESERWLHQAILDEKDKACVAAVDETPQTINLKDPAQEAAYRKCMAPEAKPRSWMTTVWDKMPGIWWAESWSTGSLV